MSPYGLNLYQTSVMCPPDGLTTVSSLEVVLFGDVQARSIWHRNRGCYYSNLESQNPQTTAKFELVTLLSLYDKLWTYISKVQSLSHASRVTASLAP